MRASLHPEPKASHVSGNVFPASLARKNLVQGICCQAMFYFGALIIAVSFFKFFLSFFSKGSPFSELQLGLVGLLLVVIGKFVGRSIFLSSLLSDFGPSARSRRSLLMLTLTVLMIFSIALFKFSVQDILRYKRLLGEGGIVEYLQALTLFVSSWVALLISKDLWKRLLKRWHGLIYGTISLGLMFVGLEELAWGQVLFGWETPKNIASINVQNQMTIHNLEFFQDYLDINLFVVSLLLLVLVLWRPSLGKGKESLFEVDNISLGTFLLPRYFWPLLLCAAILSYFVATRSATELVLNIDQEWAELMLYFSLGIGLLRSYILLGRYSNH